MRDFWDSLSVGTQDILTALALALPILIVGAVVLRGFAPWPLIRALAARFLLPVVLFVLLVAISVGTGLGLVAQERALRQGTAQAADKFDLVVAVPGSEITMLMAAVFLQPSDVPLVDGPTFAEVAIARVVDLAAPLAFGDSADGAPVVGTIAGFVTHLTDGAIEGRMWETTAEAVVGAASPFAIGDTIIPAHGIGDAVEEGAHGDLTYTVTGRMAPTGSPWDRAVLVPVEAVWEAHGLAPGHAPDIPTQLGPPFDADYFPGTPAIVIRAENLAANYGLRAQFQGTGETMAFFPGAVLSQLYTIMGDVRQAMSVLSIVSQLLVAASVLVGLYLLGRLIRRQLALLRALGAPARFVFAVVWGFATSILVTGAVLGIGVGYGAAAVLSRIVSDRTDILIQAGISWTEIHLAIGFASAASMAALIGAWGATRVGIVGALRG